jgi:hypothetical protein
MLEFRWALAQIRNPEIPKKIPKAHSCGQKGKWKLFSLTLLMEVKVAMLKYGGPLHYLNTTNF